MHKEDIENLIDSNLAVEEIIKKINLETDVKDFLKIAVSKRKGAIAVEFIEYLLENGNENIVEKNIQYVSYRIWDGFLFNDSFCNICMNNFDKIIEEQKYINFTDLAPIIIEEKEEEFFTKNILKIASDMKYGLNDCFRHLIQNTEFGEKLLVENQIELFSRIDDVNDLLFSLTYDNVIDTKIFLPGLIENFYNIVNRKKEDFILLLYIAHKMMKESKLNDKEKEEINQKMQKSIIVDGKLNPDLEAYIVNKEDEKMLQIIRDFGIEKEILKEKQELFLELFEGEKILNYINDCKEYEGITKEYTVKDLVMSIYKEHKIARDEQTLYIIERLFTEIAQAQGLEPLDISFAGSGVYSKNYKIGEFILKVGTPRETRKIPYHRRIMQPIIRQETNRNASDKNPNICVELQNLGDPTWYENLSEEEIKEELYKIYSELRDDRYLLVRYKSR